MYSCLDLNNYFNNKGITSDYDREKGNLDPFIGLSLPISYIVNKLILEKDNERIPLKFCLNCSLDNIELTGQEISFKEKIYSDIYIVGACNNGNFYNDIIVSNNNDEFEKKRFYLSDLFEENPFNEEICVRSFPYSHTREGINKYFKPKLWLYNIKLDTPFSINKIKFSENPFIHIFSITLKEGEVIEK
ncbi:hypothetical protein [Metabacillus fastidiosus]|uniref:hypothetical protein n=1 Tax=Metabacillus fastidiosus TaxID=1458 RepID=UPI003D29BB9C